jgi:hypothetical protein
MTGSPGSGEGHDRPRERPGAGPDVSRARPGSPWSQAGPESTLDEVLGDPIVHLVLHRYRLTDADVRAVVESVHAWAPVPSAPSSVRPAANVT